MHECVFRYIKIRFLPLKSKKWCCVSAAVNMPAHLENSAVSRGLEKVSFHSNPKEGQCQKCSKYYTVVFISHASKFMLKILQARLQQDMNWELPDVQAGFQRGRGTRDQIANMCWIIEKTREFQRHIYFCFTDYVKPFDFWITEKSRDSQKSNYFCFINYFKAFHCVDHNKL